MLHAEVTDRELSFAHKMSLQTLQVYFPACQIFSPKFLFLCRSFSQAPVITILEMNLGRVLPIICIFTKMWIYTRKKKLLG